MIFSRPTRLVNKRGVIPFISTENITVLKPKNDDLIFKDGNIFHLNPKINSALLNPIRFISRLLKIFTEPTLFLHF